MTDSFAGTVYVISWTVALILSSRRIVNWNSCLYHSKTLLVKQGTFLFEVWPDSAEKGDILNTGDLDISGIGYWNSVHWWIVSHQWKQNSDLFVDGRNKENRQTQDWRICEPVSDICVWQYSRKWILSGFAKSVIVVGNIFIPLVNCYHHWNSTNLNLFISELLITSENVKHRTKLVYYCTSVFLTIFEVL